MTVPSIAILRFQRAAVVSAAHQATQKLVSSQGTGKAGPFLFYTIPSNDYTMEFEYNSRNISSLLRLAPFGLVESSGPRR